MKRTLLVVLALVLLAGAIAQAGERVRFKNGHSIVAAKVAVEGDFVYLTMFDGSRIGFPKELVEDLEQGVKRPHTRVPNVAGYGGRGPSMRELSGYQAYLRRAGDNTYLAGNTAMYDPDHKGRRTYGFSYKGSGSDGGMLKPPETRNGINLFDYMYDKANAVPQVDLSSPDSARIDAGDRPGSDPKTRLIPVVPPVEGAAGAKPAPKGLPSSNPNRPK